MDFEPTLKNFHSLCHYDDICFYLLSVKNEKSILNEYINSTVINLRHFLIALTHPGSVSDCVQIFMMSKWITLFWSLRSIISKVFLLAKLELTLWNSLLLNKNLIHLGRFFWIRNFFIKRIIYCGKILSVLSTKTRWLPTTYPFHVTKKTVNRIIRKLYLKKNWVQSQRNRWCFFFCSS